MHYYHLVERHPFGADFKNTPVTLNGRRVLMLIDPAMVQVFKNVLSSEYDIELLPNRVADKVVLNETYGKLNPIIHEPEIHLSDVHPKPKPKILSEHDTPFGKEIVWMKNGEYAEPPYYLEKYYPEYYNHQFDKPGFNSWPACMRMDYNADHRPHKPGLLLDYIAKGMSSAGTWCQGRSWKPKRGVEGAPGRIGEMLEGVPEYNVGIYGKKEFILQPNEVIKAMDGYLYAVDERNGLARLLDKK